MDVVFDFRAGVSLAGSWHLVMGSCDALPGPPML
ncbi:hypothetical protein HNR46_000711 [Haloferula luteola]|uniref:Uncharacterized protein n=1 Tax=Haloferula luteola TaxID=595692 RepID=A0A840UZR1_9BACT|nr:hypothetical protein [Haloferula luteola]